MGRAGRVEVSVRNLQPLAGIAQREVQQSVGLGLHLALVSDKANQDGGCQAAGCSLLPFSAANGVECDREDGTTQQGATAASL